MWLPKRYARHFFTRNDLQNAVATRLRLSCYRPVRITTLLLLPTSMHRHVLDRLSLAYMQQVGCGDNVAVLGTVVVCHSYLSLSW